MVEHSFPFSGTSPGQAGPYSAELFRLYIETLFTGLNRANAGVLLLSGDGIDEPLTVKQTAPASAQVSVTPGAALVNGGWYYTDDDVNVTIASNTSGNPRIDYIILRFNATAQTITLVDLQGTPAGSPVPPTLTQTDTQYEIPLAQIAVANLFTTIVTANINNTVRTFARLAQYQEGGTGLSSYSAREMIAIVAAGGFGKFIPYHAAVGLNADSANITSGSWQDISTLVEMYDPDSIISVAGGTDVTIAVAGLYKFDFLCRVRNTSAGGNTDSFFRVRNNTQATTQTLGSSLTVGASAAHEIGGSGHLQFNAGDVLKFQMFSSAFTSRVEGSLLGAGTHGGETRRALHLAITRITNHGQ